ncbi:MAG: alpha-amylase [Desulfurococcaceae archaeon]
MNIGGKEIDCALRYSRSARWWPSKGMTEELSRVLFASKDLVVLELLVSGQRVLAPLALSRARPALPANMYAECGELYVYDLEYSTHFFESVSELPFVSRRVVRELRSRATVGVTPIAAGSTNVLAIHELGDGSKVVVKGYRLVGRDNPEPVMLERLSRTGFAGAPALFEAYDVRGSTAWVITEFVKGTSDGGAPFYEALTSLLKGGWGKESLRLSTASHVGLLTAELHGALNPPGEANFFGAEPIGPDDVYVWSRNIDRMLYSLLKRYDELAGIGRYSFLDEARSIAERELARVADEAAQDLEKFSGLVKARTHGDLHLAQMIYLENADDFKIVDFEGEPGRMGTGSNKVPLLRDVACLVRSFHYLSMAALMDTAGYGPPEVLRVVKGSDPTAMWRDIHVRAMVDTYVSAINTELVGLEREALRSRAWELLRPWIAERLIYEALYEALYRPEWIPIPLAGLWDRALRQR